MGVHLAMYAFIFISPLYGKTGEKISQCDKFERYSPDLSQILAFVATKNERIHPFCFPLPEKPLPLHQLHNTNFYPSLPEIKIAGSSSNNGGDSFYFPLFILLPEERRFSVSLHQ